LPDDRSGWIFTGLQFFGIPVVALAVGATVALMQFGKHFKMSKASKLIESSIEKSALVIMITAAGGAFGHVIQNSGIVEGISGYADSLQAVGFLFPFMMAAIFTTATGSLTVSMITSASLVAPLLGPLNVSPEMAVALVGSGAFCVFHVNSSFFWLLNRMHDIPPAILLRTYTLQSLAMGLSALLAVGILRIFI
jgi:GntP family gluconate:H+ symporter